MKKQLDMLLEFHTKFKAGEMGDTPKNLPLDRAQHRHDIITEEVKEYLQGVKQADKQNIAKELCDILFTVYGTIIEHNMQDIIEQCFDEVHRSNMSKDYSPSKMIKGENYSPADLSKIIK